MAEPKPCAESSRRCSPKASTPKASTPKAGTPRASAAAIGSPRSGGGGGLLASPAGSPLGGGGALSWSAKEVEADLLSGRLEPETVLRELRRAMPSSELRLSEVATRVLSGSYGSTLAPLCSAQLMAVFREVSGTPRAAVTASSPIPAPQAVSELRAELGHAGIVDGEFCDVLLLLWLLAQRILVDGADEPAAAATPSAHARPASVETADGTARRHLTSSLLSAKLQRQLSDALAVSSGALPLWSRLLLERCPALFSSRARTMYFRSSAFGVSRSVYWSQEAQVTATKPAASSPQPAHAQRACTRTRTCARVHAHAHTCTRAHAHTRAHTRTRAQRTRAHAHTHARTRMRTW